MKNCFFAATMALAMVLALSFAAFAEAPALPDMTQDAAAEEPAAEADDSAALQEAMDAFRAAKDADRQASLEAELKAYVEAGKLTQAQADLILKNMQDRQTRRDGQDFRRGSGKGGQMNGGRGGKMNGGRGKGGRMAQDGQQPPMDNAQDGAQTQAFNDTL